MRRHPPRPAPAGPALPLLAALLLLLLAQAAAPAPAQAYIGPGAGITMLGALWGVVAALALALGAVLFWPVRALLRRARGRKGGPAEAGAPTPAAAARDAGTGVAAAVPQGRRGG